MTLRIPERLRALRCFYPCAYEQRRGTLAHGALSLQDQFKSGANSALSATGLGADDADLEDAYNTERHLLCVACTRARDQLLSPESLRHQKF